MTKLTAEQRRMLARVDYATAKDAEEAKRRLQVKLQVELEIASGIGTAA